MNDLGLTAVAVTALSFLQGGRTDALKQALEALRSNPSPECGSLYLQLPPLCKYEREASPKQCPISGFTKLAATPHLVLKAEVINSNPSARKKQFFVTRYTLPFKPTSIEAPIM